MTYEEEFKKLEMVKLDKRMYKIKLRNHQLATSREFKLLNKKWIHILDIFVILIVLSNYGALFITNALVVKANPEIQLQEANEIQAELNNYEKAEDGQTFMIAIFIQTIFWVILISVYLFNRAYLIGYGQLTVMTILVFYYFILLTLDFINNFGYLVGFWLWK